MPERPNTAVFTFATTHQAMAAEDVLRVAGVDLEVVPPPPELNPGCGLALEVSLRDVATAREALASAGALWDAIHEVGPAQELVTRLE